MSEDEFAWVRRDIASEWQTGTTDGDKDARDNSKAPNDTPQVPTNDDSDGDEDAKADDNGDADAKAHDDGDDTNANGHDDKDDGDTNAEGDDDTMPALEHVAECTLPVSTLKMRRKRHHKLKVVINVVLGSCEMYLSSTPNIPWTAPEQRWIRIAPTSPTLFKTGEKYDVRYYGVVADVYNFSNLSLLSTPTTLLWVSKHQKDWGQFRQQYRFWIVREQVRGQWYTAVDILSFPECRTLMNEQNGTAIDADLKKVTPDTTANRENERNSRYKIKVVVNTASHICNIYVSLRPNIPWTATQEHWDYVTKLERTLDDKHYDVRYYLWTSGYENSKEFVHLPPLSVDDTLPWIAKHHSRWDDFRTHYCIWMVDDECGGRWCPANDILCSNRFLIVISEWIRTGVPAHVSSPHSITASRARPSMSHSQRVWYSFWKSMLLAMLSLAVFLGSFVFLAQQHEPICPVSTTVVVKSALPTVWQHPVYVSTPTFEAVLTSEPTSQNVTRKVTTDRIPRQTTIQISPFVDSVIGRAYHFMYDLFKVHIQRTCEPVQDVRIANVHALWLGYYGQVVISATDNYSGPFSFDSFRLRGATNPVVPYENCTIESAITSTMFQGTALHTLHLLACYQSQCTFVASGRVDNLQHASIHISMAGRLMTGSNHEMVMEEKLNTVVNRESKKRQEPTIPTCHQGGQSEYVIPGYVIPDALFTIVNEDDDDEFFADDTQTL